MNFVRNDAEWWRSVGELGGVIGEGEEEEEEEVISDELVFLEMRGAIEGENGLEEEEEELISDELVSLETSGATEGTGLVEGAILLL